MSKSIYFFGQSVFGQLISLIDKKQVDWLAKKTQTDRHCKGFTTWDHLVTMLFCSIGHCYSLREVVGGCLGLKGKSGHIGLTKLPRRSTLSDANKKRSCDVFEKIYQSLLKRYRADITDSRRKSNIDKEMYIIDSTTISLFRAILKCVGRKPANGKEKGGIKTHTLIKAEENVPDLVWYSSAATHDSRFWGKIEFKRDALYVFDMAYVDYEQYEQFTQQGIWFTSKLKDNASHSFVKEIPIDDAVDSRVIKDEWIQLPIRENGQEIRSVLMRRVVYLNTETKEVIDYITNLGEHIKGEQIVDLYKKRWQIETMFKQLKQNFPLKYFLGDNENAIKIQIWCVLISNLLFTVIQKKIERKLSFSNMVSFCRLHLFNYIHLIRFLNDPEKDWEKVAQNEPNLFSG